MAGASIGEKFIIDPCVAFFKAILEWLCKPLNVAIYSLVDTGK
ncbi:hypothetical protein [Pseudoteredinibacter isoporae]|nr:hypothetical protein [Pseudoteredinibacter isoporae]